MVKKQHRYLAFLLPVQIVVIQILSYFPAVVEKYYSNGIYPYLSKALRFAFGWLPFSFGDLMYLILIVLLVRFVVVNFRKKAGSWKSLIYEVGAGVSIIYAAFNLFWGLNYYRLPAHEVLHLESEYTTEELVHVSAVLGEKANALHKKLQPIDSVAVAIPYSKKEIFELTIPTYSKLHKKFPKLYYPPTSIKTSLWSILLTYMGFSGYLNPITNEAQVNGLILNYKAPTTSCHEQAHQLGFAAENEANFIAALATMNAGDSYFRYSGTTFSLKYCIRELYARDEQLGICQMERLRPGIIKNYEEVIDFWMSYRNPFEPAFKASYDTFLKANNQKKGIKSYQYVVTLLVNYLKCK